MILPDLYSVEKPWGSYSILLDEKYTKVKKISVHPGEYSSYQQHKFRSEIWVVVLGEIYARINDITTVHYVGDSIFIPQNTPHQIINKSTSLSAVIETQLGSYFGEDDIIRLEDKYGRL